MKLLRKKKPARWSIVTSAPKGDAGRQWGDYYFARDLAAALEQQGVHATVVSKAGANAQAREKDDVVVVLRGLRRVVPNRPHGPRATPTTWILWVISHPELIEPGEREDYDLAFAASASWPRAAANEQLGDFTTLLQATNTERFTPLSTELGSRALFVGSTRGEFRPIVRDALASGIDVELYGVGWEEFVEPHQISGEFLANDELPVAYSKAAVVLNDHHADMARAGFLSNRLFDAVASGARVVSDNATGMREVFGDLVLTYDSPDHLAQILRNPDAHFGPRNAPAAVALKDRILREHCFAARAATLISAVETAQGSRGH